MIKNGEIEVAEVKVTLLSPFIETNRVNGSTPSFVYMLVGFFFQYSRTETFQIY